MKCKVVEIRRTWPKERDLDLPPFFVDASRSDGLYVVAGTFRTGVTSYFAVPLNVADKGWLGLIEEERVADEAVFRLNQLHAEGLIDWSGEFPRILTPEERDRIIKRAEMPIQASEANRQK